MREAEEKSAGPWLSVVGIGEDGVEGLSAVAKSRIAEAEVVFGGRRHLSLVATLANGAARPWPSPFDPEMRDVIALRGQPVCVLASGDPFLHGVGTTLSRRVSSREMLVLPAPSSLSLAANRLGWPLPDVETISLHGKPVDLIRPLLHPHTRVLALTSDADGPAEIARLLAANGFGASRLTVLEALGGPKERIRAAIADTFDLKEINPLNVLAIEVESNREARILPLACGLDDDLFEHDGQITKRQIRAVTLSALAPRRGELLWDIGAGSGSIGIEWMLRHPSLRAVAIEQDAARGGRIARNASLFGVPGLTVVQGVAPAALQGLEPPDAIFIGGGGSDPDVVWAAIEALRPGGRLVANAVTLEMEAVLLMLQGQIGGNLTRLSVSRAVPVGAMQGWKPAMPVTQWSWLKP